MLHISRIHCISYNAVIGSYGWLRILADGHRLFGGRLGGKVWISHFPWAVSQDSRLISVNGNEKKSQFLIAHPRIATRSIGKR